MSVELVVTLSRFDQVKAQKLRGRVLYSPIFITHRKQIQPPGQKVVCTIPPAFLKCPSSSCLALEKLLQEVTLEGKLKHQTTKQQSADLPYGSEEVVFNEAAVAQGSSQRLVSRRSLV